MRILSVSDLTDLFADVRKISERDSIINATIGENCGGKVTISIYCYDSQLALQVARELFMNHFILNESISEMWQDWFAGELNWVGEIDYGQGRKNYIFVRIFD